MRITEEEQENRRNRMVHTAYDLFCEHGIDNVSIVQIAETAGLSKNSIFRYFKNKAELAFCTQIILWQEITDHILSEGKKRLSNSKTGLEAVKILSYGFKDMYENHSKYLLFSCDCQLFLVRSHVTLSARQHDDVLKPIFMAFTEAIKRGHDDGSISKTQSVKMQFLSLWGVLRAYVEKMAIYDKLYDGENPLASQFDVVLNHIIHGITA